MGRLTGKIGRGVPAGVVIAVFALTACGDQASTPAQVGAADTSAVQSTVDSGYGNSEAAPVSTSLPPVESGEVPIDFPTALLAGVLRFDGECVKVVDEFATVWTLVMSGDLAASAEVDVSKKVLLQSGSGVALGEGEMVAVTGGEAGGEIDEPACEGPYFLAYQIS